MATMESKEKLLAGFQHKKGAMIISFLKKTLRPGTPIRWGEIVGWEDYNKMVNGELQARRRPTYAWQSGIVTGLKYTGRGLNYTINAGEGVVSVSQKQVITEEMYQFIQYHPTLVLLYDRSYADEPTLVVMHTYDSLYLGCPILRAFKSALSQDFVEFIDAVEAGSAIVDEDEDNIPMPPQDCTLNLSGDCRQCLVHFINGSSGWEESRERVDELIGRGTMYSEGKYKIRKRVNRELFIRWMKVENWLKGRTTQHVVAFLDSLSEFSDTFGIDIPVLQIEKVKTTIHQIIKDEEDEDLVEGIKARVKELTPYLEDETLEVEEEEVATSELEALPEEEPFDGEEITEDLSLVGPFTEVVEEEASDVVDEEEEITDDAEVEAVDEDADVEEDVAEDAEEGSEEEETSEED